MWVILIVAAVVLPLVAVGVVAGLKVGTDPNKDVPLFEVARGRLVISVTESGTIKNRQQVVVRSEVEGRNAILWLIAEGGRVEKGAKLVELDASKLQDQAAQQQIVVQNADASFVRARENRSVAKSQGESDIAKAVLALKFAKLDRLKYLKGEYPQELKQVEAQITLAKEELQRAEDKRDWSARLAKEGYITRTELQADELATKKADLDLKLARGRLDLLKEYTYTRQVEQLDSDITQAKMALDRAQGKDKADRAQASADFRAKQSEFARQKARLEKLQGQIAKCVIRAPVSGMVVYATTGKGHRWSRVEPLEKGQEVRERQELIYLPTTTSMMADIKLHESNLQKVKEGMPALIRVGVLKDATFHGRVGKIAPTHDQVAAFLNPDLKVFATEIYIDGDAGKLNASMSCKVEIIVAQYEDVLYVPVQAVTRVKGQHVVYVPGAHGPELREVEVGLDNNRMIHIKSGLKAGQNVLLEPPLDQSQVADWSAEAVKLPGPGAAPEKPKAPTTRPAMDRSRPEAMTPEQRRKWYESLTPEQKEQMRSRRGGRRGGRNGRRGGED